MSLYAQIPPGRGRWRVTLHNRTWTGTSWQDTIIAQLDGARSRRLVTAWNTPAEFDFTMNSRDPACALIRELATDVIVWRYDTFAGSQDRMMFRGIIDHSEDQITEQSATVNFVAHDYSAMLQRRWTTQPYSVTQHDQDLIAGDLVYMASNMTSSAAAGTSPPAGTPVSFVPGSWLPLTVSLRNPDNSFRGGYSGQLRDRTYAPSSELFTLLDELSKVIGGFDWAVIPYGGGGNTDGLAVFYPQVGAARTDFPLMYGSNVAGLTRTVSSGDYANYVRVVGNNGSDDPAAAQRFAEAWNPDANNVTVNPVGLWMDSQNAADVSIQSTLDQTAQGALALSGILVPSYTLTMRPDAMNPGYPGQPNWATNVPLGGPNIGDTVPLIANVGRLNVNTTVRVLGITFAIGDDGQEDIQLTVGRPPGTLAGMFNQTQRDIDALARR